MRNKLYIAGLLALGSLGGIVGVANAQTAFSTTTLGTAIDSVSGTTYDYFTVLIAKFWPYLLGATILVGVVVFGKRIIHSLFGK